MKLPLLSTHNKSIPGLTWFSLERDTGTKTKSPFLFPHLSTILNSLCSYFLFINILKNCDELFLFFSLHKIGCTFSWIKTGLWVRVSDTHSSIYIFISWTSDRSRISQMVGGGANQLFWPIFTKSSMKLKNNWTESGRTYLVRLLGSTKCGYLQILAFFRPEIFY